MLKKIIAFHKSTDRKPYWKIALVLPVVPFWAIGKVLVVPAELYVEFIDSFGRPSVDDFWKD